METAMRLKTIWRWCVSGTLRSDERTASPSSITAHSKSRRSGAGSQSVCRFCSSTCGIKQSSPLWALPVRGSAHMDECMLFRLDSEQGWAHMHSFKYSSMKLHMKIHDSPAVHSYLNMLMPCDQTEPLTPSHAHSSLCSVQVWFYIQSPVLCWGIFVTENTQSRATLWPII